ncbi:hypothetical protein BS78_07G060500 [Paspalum vaginatum]|nr:hypothetical protein BS78_07G060500 [Paspalum vaginatum]
MAGAEDRDLKGLRRSRRVRKATMIKEMGGASEEFQIVMLKRQMKAVIARNEAALKDDAAPLEPLQPPEPVGSGKKRKVVKTEVQQEFIDHMILNPHRPSDGFREENLGKCNQKWRNLYFRQKELADTVLEYQQALIKQYRTKGYAVDCTEVTDDEDDS